MAMPATWLEMSQKPGRSKRSAWTDVKPADRTRSSVRRSKWHPSAGLLPTMLVLVRWTMPCSNTYHIDTEGGHTGDWVLTLIKILYRRKSDAKI